MNSSNLRVFMALLMRDVFVMRRRIISFWIDVSVVLVLEVIMFGSLLPRLGISTDSIAPFFIGAVISQTFFKAMSKAFVAVRDLRFSRVIDYHLTFPIAKRWLFAQYITSWVIEILMTMVPFLIVGIIALGSSFPTVHASWLHTSLFFIATSVVSSVLLLALAYHYEYNWFMKNIWPRRLNFVFGFCPFFFIWRDAYQFSPRIAQSLLLNPFTYCVEGFRAALLGQDRFINMYLCYGMILFFFTLFCLFFTHAVKTRLDPV